MSSAVYYFWPISELTEIGYDNEDVRIVKKIIENIPSDKNCAYIHKNVSQKATVDFVSKIKLLEDCEVEYLTYEKAWEKIREELFQFKDSFVDGVDAPNGKESISLMVAV